MPPYAGQHTIPKFYLAGFGDSAEKSSKNPYLWYYPMDEPPPRRWRRELAQDISVLTDYYTYTEGPDERRHDLERDLGRIEDWAAPAIKKLKKRETPTSKDMISLSWFVAIMASRVPAEIDLWGEFEVATIRNALRQQYLALRDDPRRIAPFIAELRAAGYEFADTTDPEAFNFEKVRIEPVPSGIATRLLRFGVEQAAPRLNKMRWDVLVTTADAPFITSDAPFCMLVPHVGSGGLYDPDIQVTLPLSRTVAVRIEHDAANPPGHATVNYIPAPLSSVRLMNLRTAGSARHFIASSAIAFPGNHEILTTVAHRRPTGSVP